MADHESTDAYWRDIYCVDCNTKLTPRNGARRPVANSVYQLVCVNCLLREGENRGHGNGNT
jgi:RNase P subunit RPR2